MPTAGASEGTVFLHTVQAMYFSDRKPFAIICFDNSGTPWALEEGRRDSETRNYGLFEDGNLIAHIKILAPEMSAEDCPTQYWSIGRIAVLDKYQGRGIGPALLGAVARLYAPLASDVVQTAGGAGMWKKMIRNSSQLIELHDSDGLVDAVEYRDGAYVPDPWDRRETRLVLRG